MRTAGPERYACTCGRAMFMCIAITHEPRESIIVCGHRRGVHRKMRAQQLICVTCCRSAEVGGGG
jgi:hypothetical protein